MKQFKIILLLVLVTSVTCYASSLEEGKEIINNYYKFSMEKDIDSYIQLFDQKYLTEIYGNNYKNLFTEIFSYYEINDYKIDYQYYTESDDSMTIFFNLESEMVIEGEKNDIDNDLVAFFTKSDKTKLRYIILQEEFIGQMNREFIYETAVSKIIQEENNLKEEAISEGVDLDNYESIFEEKISEYENKHSSNKFFWIILLIAILIIVYQFSIKKDKISKHIKDEKTKNNYLKVRKKVIYYVDKAYFISKKWIKKAIKFLISTSIKLYQAIKERLQR
ncbi:MAG: hypothetical protein ACOCP4_03530 [Candidatus Woesearchaeota archaeon]